MRTAFRSEQLADAHMQGAERALRTCVHCGFCTATCPTYLVLGDERDSPRGRIMLMQQMLESGAPPSAQTVTHLDRCLSCLGCRTTCPSGVDYAALIDTSRSYIEKHYRRPLGERLFRDFVLFVLMRPSLFALLSRTARLFAPLLKRLPGRLGTMARKAPPLQQLTPAHRQIPQTGEGAPRVALLPGCVQHALAPTIDASARRVLAKQNIAAAPLPGAGCCGSLAYHLGKEDLAKDCAKRVITAFEQADAQTPQAALLITATGCSAFLKDYPRLFANEPEWRTRALALAVKAKDFSELADPARVTHAAPLPTVAYHPPCSLQHGQKIAGRGEALLAAAGFALRPIPDSHLCCGSAGSYSVLQPEISNALRERKVASLKATGAQVLASGNAGCLNHLAGPDSLPSVHIAELLDWADGGPRPPALG
jgi:glycolate oxidase iron-sulfur subunit